MHASGEDYVIKEQGTDQRLKSLCSPSQGQSNNRQQQQPSLLVTLDLESLQ